MGHREFRGVYEKETVEEIVFKIGVAIEQDSTFLKTS